MRKLTREELLAMLVFREEYANSGLSAIEFYRSLSAFRKGQVDTWLRELDAAKEKPRRRK